MAATGSRFLTSLRPISLSSSHPSSPRSHAIIHRLQYRLFHLTTPSHRKPPPTKIVKAQPRFTTPTYQPPKVDDNARQNQQQQPSPPPPPNQDAKQTPKRKRSKWPTIALVAALLFAFPPLLTVTKDQKPLNKDTFAPFTITAREQVSPTAFILTLEPAPPKRLFGSNSSKPKSDSERESVDVIEKAWEHGLWSIEVKQPELQVARDYTPLPLGPSSLADALEGVEEGGDGKLRLYIRRMERGEVSGYLARLKVGDTVELRGPRLGFDLRKRVGVADGEVVEEGKKKKKKVVFFAGGTGIAPALQAARALLDQPGVEMEVVWANRRKEDCVGCDGGEGEKGAVVAMLEDFKRKYGERFRYSCTVDEQGSFIDATTVKRLARVSSPPAEAPAPARVQWTWGLWSSAGSRDSAQVTSPAALVNDEDCAYHSAKKLVVSDEKDVPAGTDGEPCQCKDVDGNPVKGGKNLLMFSGPDGFMAHYVGAKVWAGGKELQGPVKGVVGELKRKYPNLGEDWLVLKL